MSSINQVLKKILLVSTNKAFNFNKQYIQAVYKVSHQKRLNISSKDSKKCADF